MASDRDSPTVVGTHVYTIVGSSRATMALFGVGWFAVSVYFLMTIQPEDVRPQGGAWFWFLGLLMGGNALLGLYFVAQAFRHRLTLSREGIELRNVFRPRTLRNDEIAGWRLDASTPGISVIVLTPKNRSARKLRIARFAKTDVVFERWLESLPNPDKVEIEHREKGGNP